MTWTAKVVRTTPIGNQFESSVLFQNDADTTQNFQQSFLYSGDQAELEEKCRERLSGDTVDAPVVGTILDLASILSITPLPVQSLADVAQASWLEAYQRVVRLQRGQAAGVAGITAKTVSDAQATLNNLPYDPSYESLL